MTRRKGKLGLWFSLWASDWRSGILPAIVIFAVVFGASSALALSGRVFSEELRVSVADQLTLKQRYLSAESIGFPAWPAVVTPSSKEAEPGSNSEAAVDFEKNPWVPNNKVDEWLSGLSDDLAAPLQEFVGEADFYSFDSFRVVRSLVDSSGPQQRLIYAMDPKIADRIELTAGRIPEVNPELYLELAREFQSDSYEEFERFMAARSRSFEERAPVEILMHESAAKDYGWELNEIRAATLLNMPEYPVQLVGTFQEKSDTDAYWQYTDTVIKPYEFDDGDGTWYLSGTVYLVPEVWYTLQSQVNQTTRAWIEFDISGIDTENVTELLPQLANFSGKNHQFDQNSAGLNLTLKFDSAVYQQLSTSLERVSAVNSLLTMIVLGPAIAAALIILLANNLTLLGRRPALALLFARGASLARVRAVHFIEGAVVALPAALLAVAAVYAAFGVSATLPALILAAIAVLANGLLLAFPVRKVSLIESRSELASAKISPLRIILELLAVLLAGVGLYLLLSRGLGAGSDSGSGFDPLLVTIPVLLIFATGILVLRVYPLPLAALRGFFKKSRKLTGFLGSSRAVSERSGGLVPILALLLTLSIAFFSTLLLSTITEATERRAWQSVGADLKLQGPILGESELAELASAEVVEEVLQLSTITNLNRVVLSRGGEQTPVSIVFADFESLAEFQSTSRWKIPGLVASASDTESGGAIKVLVSEKFGIPAGSSEYLLQGTPVLISGAAPALPGLEGIDNWVLVDLDHSKTFVKSLLSNLTLINFADSAGQNEKVIFHQSLINSYGENLVKTQSDYLNRLDSLPSNVALKLVLILAAVTSLLLALLAVYLISVGFANGRRRILPVLAALGLQKAQRRSLLAWELTPVVVAAGLSSLLIGLGLGWLITSTVELSGFVGGGENPGLHFDLALVAGLLAVIAVWVVLVTSWNHHRVEKQSLVTELRS